MPADSAALTPPAAPDAVVFDLGGVLIDWNPRHLFRTLFADETAMEEFLTTVATPEWNHEQDRGRSWAEAVALLSAQHPHHAEHIAAYHQRWSEMLGGEISSTVEVLAELRDAGVRLYALTNWSAETFPVARERFPFLRWFGGVLVSGQERLAKPDPAIYELLAERFRLDPARSVFIDDVARNVEAASAAGYRATLFTSAGALRQFLADQGLPVGVEAPARSAAAGCDG